MAHSFNWLYRPIHFFQHAVIVNLANVDIWPRKSDVLELEPYDKMTYGYAPELALQADWVSGSGCYCQVGDDLSMPRQKWRNGSYDLYGDAKTHPATQVRICVAGCVKSMGT